ncbi:polysaccharide biosynthesis protein [Legionella lansingensis]|uniref:Polysaccharide biosynthesis protein n=1 Tax=Legionella lansingensis TaxID=45067 RepID=A0A0W0VWN0_9GAMM|nr:DegT/DnrJ/EryC1/StrS aminotransferase family protein [Legionella lansingensis]KTD24329.1 polysaccharide biosynthesis protein [Legionella lansingensis]SNV51777.1 polysaccharide biosynthesis protein [Legionella lansingensis]
MWKRQISLYLGSITIWRSLQGIALWLASLWRNAEAQRRRLHQEIKKTYCSSSAGVFSFGSGRSALTACLKAAGIGPGDEVLLSAYTCLAVPTAVIAVGAKPIYVDISADTLNVEWDAVSKVLSSRVRAIVVQHTLGKPVPQVIIENAKAQGILVIEDCALSIGSKVDDRYVGTLADAAILSMELSKTLSVGWGGILIVNDQQLVHAVEKFYAQLHEPSWWSATRDLWQTVISAWCYHPLTPYVIKKYTLAVGFKSRIFRPSTPKLEFDGIVSSNFLMKMGGIQAALAILQWRDFAKIISACERNAAVIRESLAKLNIFIPGSPSEDEISVAPRVSFLVANRELAVRYFGERGVELGQWFDGPLSPIPTSPLFNYQAGSYPLAESVANQIINIPCHSRLKQYDLQHIVNLVEKFIQDHPGCAVQEK